MAKVEVIMPKMGEGVIEATITRWLVGNNSKINEDDPIVEIATDKVDSEIPAPVQGTLIKRFYHEGEIVKVGEILAIIETNNHIGEGELVSFSDSSTDSVALKSVVAGGNRINKRATPRLKTESFNENSILPFIRFYARQRGITIKELLTIQGSGKNGQITKQDVIEYFKIPKQHTENDKQNEVPVISELNEDIVTEYIAKDGEEVVELDKTRKLIAEHMLRSVKVAPHVTSFVEADVTPLVQWREAIKEEFQAKYDVKLTYTPVFVEAVIKALKEFPDINVSLFQTKVIRKKYINIGIATALPGGNLIVPVIKDADKINFNQLAIQLTDLTKRAKSGNLKPGETSGGTFTITNLALVGNVSGTPIINQPESAILAVGAIRKKPWVLKHNNEHVIGIRDIVTLSLSYDHRIIDGALGGAFLSRIAALLEEFRPQEI